MSNGDTSVLLQFKSQGSDAQISAAELSAIGWFYGGDKPLIDDFTWTGVPGG